jgi:hypothetical protein
MARTRIVEIAAAAALAGSLAACSSTTSNAAAPVSSTSSTSTAPSATETTSTASASQTPTAADFSTSVATSPTTSAPVQTQTVAALLAKWGKTGRISTKNMPTADPGWTARVQHSAEAGTNPAIAANDINLIALVDEAAREHDIASLVRLSNGAATSERLSQPGLLDGLVNLLEKTHPIGQNGYTYPGFSVTGGSGVDSAGLAIEKSDAAALGLSSTSGYKGVHTYFDGNWSGGGADGSLEWTSV